MAVRRQIYLWAGYVAFMILILFCVYKSSGAKSAANSAAVVLMVFFGFSVVQWLARHYPVTTKSGWHVLGPDPNDLISIGMPVYIALMTLMQHWIGYYFFSDFSDFSYSYLLHIYIEQPLFSLFVGCFMLYGILKGFVRRLRWNEQRVEFRDMFFETRLARWDEIDRGVLGGAFVGNEAILKSGARIVLPNLTGRAGASKLEADARARGIAIIAGQ